MNYRILDHTQRLHARSFLKSIYVLKNGELPCSYGCVPNGEIGISVILSGKGWIHRGDERKEQPRVALYGLVRKAQFHTMSPDYHEINLGFEPHKLQLLLRDRLRDLPWDDATGLEMLIGKARTQQLFEQLNEASSDQAIVDAIEGFLSHFAACNQMDPRVKEAHRLILNEGVVQVDDLSRRIGISGTALRQLFADNLGMTPKELIKIKRIRTALHFKMSDLESLTDMAYQLKYFDQAHFIHDFRNTVGLTPGQYFSNEKLTFDFYNYGRWDHSSFAGVIR